MHQRRRALTLVKALTVLGILLLLVAFLLQALVGAHPDASRYRCVNNLKKLGLALHKYHDVHGELPPAYTVDEAGNRLHSWRALILPYIEKQALFEKIDFTKPWDDPANEKARGVALEVFDCPITDVEPGMTTYLALVGPNWPFAGAESRSFHDIRDGTARTIALTEIEASRAVHWMSPYDLEEGAGLSFTKESAPHRPGAFFATFLDGHIESLPADIQPELLSALLTIADGEDVQAMREEE